MRTDTPQPIHLSAYTPPAWLVDKADLTFRLDPAASEVTARLSLRPNPAAAAADVITLDGEKLELVSAAIDGEVVAADRLSVSAEALTIRGVPQRPLLLTIITRCNPAANTELSGLYRSNGMYCTQCEAEGFRRITYFPDRPDVLARYHVRIEAPAEGNPVLLSNGNPGQRGTLADGWHFAEWDDPFPKPSYLFALVAGDLACAEDSFTTASGRPVTLRIFVEHGKEDRCGFAMEALKKSMRWDEEAFGREYDLDIFMIVAVSDFNMGAMENKGLNVFNDKYVLARPDTATDMDYALIEGIIAHEYFHNWTGNRITCRDWFQLCLKEGLTVYRDQEFSADMRSRAVKRIADVRTLRAQQFPEDAGPLAHPVRPSSYIEINNFYTATVYEKGAEIVRMLRTLIGPDAFRAGMDLYFARHDGEAATVEQFITCFAESSGRDLAQFFRWYEQPGTPEVTAQGRFDADARIYELTLTQAPGAAAPAGSPPLHIPIVLGLVGPNGADMPLDLDGRGLLADPVVELTERSQTFRFRGIGAQPVLSLNRGFAAPIKAVTGQSPEELVFLMGHDSDPFNRWEAAQELGRGLILASMAALAGGRALPATSAFSGALAQSLADPALEPAFLAQLLTLPGEADILGEITRDADPALIRRAREAVRAALAGELRDHRLSAIWAAGGPKGPYRPDAADAGRRALRFAALGLLAAADPAGAAGLALAHQRAAASMSDETGALAILTQIDRPEREEGLSLFYRQHAADHLLVDKWFALEASVPLASTVARVDALMAHADFRLTTPNRVRALIGGFMANPAAFHAADGSGYELAARVLGDLDSINPQVAARLLGGFKSWRRMDAGRRTAAEAALRGLIDKPGLSRDSYEIVSRTLA